MIARCRLPVSLLWPFVPCAVVAAMVGCSETSNPAADAVQRALDQATARAYAEYAGAHATPPAGSAGVLVHLVTPTRTWTSGAGLSAGAGADSRYRIQSVSKTFTAAGIMLLDQRGKLRIDDPVTATIPGSQEPYLPASPAYAFPDKEKTTIAQLLAHRAGFFDVYNDPLPATVKDEKLRGVNYIDYVRKTLKDPDHQFTFDELIAVVSENGLSYFRPGTAYHYSDAGYMLLAKIIERVSGQDYDRFLADNFWTPMGMAQTSAPWKATDSGLPAPFLRGFTRRFGAPEFADDTENNMSCQVGPGNVISTPADMGRWIRLLLSGRGPLTPATVARMTRVAPGNVSYGLGIVSNVLGLGHGGADRGYVDLVQYNPDDDVAVVTMMPFIDYGGVAAQMALMMDLGRKARAAAGYTDDYVPLALATRQAVQAALDQAAAEAQVPGAVVTVSSPEGATWNAVTGFSDLAAGQRMTPGLKFRIGSITKTFTAVAILQLVKEGRLQLEQTIRSVPGMDALLNAIPPGSTPIDPAITIRQLLNHTSGLFDYAHATQPPFLPGLLENPTRRWTIQELVGIAAASGAYSKPGAEVHYSNTNYLLLGHILESITGSTFAEIVESRFLGPLALHGTSVPVDQVFPGGATSADMPSGSTRGYSWYDDGKTALWLDTTRFDTTWAGAAGNMISSAADLLVWLDALRRGAFLDDALLNEQLTFVPIATGLGYGLGVESRGRTIGHTGDFVYGGQSAMYEVDGWRFVVLVNASPRNAQIAFASEYILDRVVAAAGVR